MRYEVLGCSVLLGAYLVAPSVGFAADLETIKERGHLIVAVKDNWRPLGFRDPQGNVVGFEIEVAAHLAEELFGDSSALVLRPVANQERLSTVLSGEVDIAIAGVSITPARQRIVSFSSPYYLDGTAFITNDPSIESLQDLAAERIALLEGSDAVANVHYALPSATLVGVSSYQAALDQIAAGWVDAVAADVTVLTGLLQEYPNYQLLPSVLTAEPLAVVLPKGNQYSSLRQFLNTSIEQWHQEGWLETRATYWGLP